MTVRIRMRLRQWGGRKLIMTPKGAAVTMPQPRPDETLIKSLVGRTVGRDVSMPVAPCSISDFAEQEGVGRLRLPTPVACRAPAPVEAILRRRQPKGLRLAEMLGRTCRLE